MKIVSLCAGVGVTDKCFTLYGGEVLVANDLSAGSLKVYKKNHPGTQTVAGDLCDESTQNSIINAAQGALKGEPLDLLILFFPPGKKSKAIIAATTKIAESLNAKLIYIDALGAGKYTHLKKESGVQGCIKEHLAGYHLQSTCHNLSDYGVPSNNKREPYFLLNKNYFNDTHRVASTNYVNNVPKTLRPTVKEALKPIWDVEPVSENDKPAPQIDDQGLQLHRTVYALDHGLPSGALKTKIDQMKQGDKLFHRGSNEKMDEYYRQGYDAQRVDAGSVFNYTVSSKARAGFFWKMHPTGARGFTPLEILFLMTMDKIPFELSSGDNTLQCSIIRRIAGATPPAYLLRLIGHTIIPILKLENPALALRDTNTINFNSEQKKFSAMELSDIHHYLGSNRAMKSTKSTIAKTICAPSNQSEAPKDAQHSQQLSPLVKDTVMESPAMDDNMLSQFSLFPLPHIRQRTSTFSEEELQLPPLKIQRD